MTSRDDLYLLILRFGLLRLREAAAAGKSEYCSVEADHLHNIPSLIGEPNEERHKYYIERERSLYLERVDRNIPGIDFTLNRYEELWIQLEKQKS